MSIRITSAVTKSRTEPNAPEPWYVTSSACDPSAEPSRRFVLGTFGTAATFPEALALAAQQRDGLHAELMEAVHESRATRREVPTS